MKIWGLILHPGTPEVKVQSRKDDIEASTLFIAATHSSYFFFLKGMKYFYSTQSKLLSRWDRKGRLEVWQFLLCAVCFQTGRVGSPGIPRPPRRAEIQDCQNGFPQFWCKITSCTGGVQDINCCLISWGQSCTRDLKAIQSLCMFYMHFLTTHRIKVLYTLKCFLRWGSETSIEAFIELS